MKMTNIEKLRSDMLAIISAADGNELLDYADQVMAEPPDYCPGCAHEKDDCDYMHCDTRIEEWLKQESEV